MNRSESRLRTNSRIVPPDLMLRFGYSPNGGIKFDSTAAILSFYQGGAQRVDIGSFGLSIRAGEGLVVGHSAQLTMGIVPETQIVGTGALGEATLGIFNFEANANGADIRLGKSRSVSAGTYTVVQNGDQLGRIIFHGSDGADIDSEGARISAEVDGTPGANDLPTRLVFSTTADGASSVTEALRLDASQLATFAGDISAQNASFAGTISVPEDRGIYFDGGTDDFIRSDSGSTLSVYLAGTERVKISGSSISHSQAGSATSPAFSWTADTNTGMYRLASDHLGFSAGGQSKIQMDATSVYFGTHNALGAETVTGSSR